MLIGLCGYPGAGKSEITNILTEEYGFMLLDVKRPLRKAASIFTGVPQEEFVKPENKDKLFNGVPGRTIMGELGNATERLWGDDFLLQLALSELKEEDLKRGVVVDSLRKEQPRYFPSNGIILQVISERARNTGNDFDQFYQGNTDKIIVNDGSIDDLRESIKRVLNL